MEAFRMTFDCEAPCLSPSYVVPENIRPNLKNVCESECIPIIDLQLGDRGVLVGQVSEACEKLGLFRVINHGIPEQLCDDVLETVTQFFHLPPEQKRQYMTTDHRKKVKIFNYYAKDEEERKINMWSETFTLPWDPAKEEYLDLVPQNPSRYREVYGAYAREMGRLMDTLLGLMSLGLGLEEGSLKSSIGHSPELYSQANYYPPCPHPDLTLGLKPHTDIVAIAVLLQTQGPPGLQILNHDQWTSVHPIPNSLIINLADQLQVLSNGRYKSVVHRAVTNSHMARLSMVMFYAPNDAAVIKPIEELTHEHNPPMYTSFTYGQFMEEFHAREGKERAVKEAFQITKYN